MNYYCPRDGNVTVQLFGRESILLLCFLGEILKSGLALNLPKPIETLEIWEKEGRAAGCPSRGGMAPTFPERGHRLVGKGCLL